MTYDYWVGPKTDLDAKIDLTDFDSLGLHKFCVQYERGIFAREAPTAVWDLGPTTEVIIKCSTGEDMSVHYPNFVEKTLVEIKAHIAVVDNHYEEPV